MKLLEEKDRLLEATRQMIEEKGGMNPVLFMTCDEMDKVIMSNLPIELFKKSPQKTISLIGMGILAGKLKSDGMEEVGEAMILLDTFYREAKEGEEPTGEKKEAVLMFYKNKNGVATSTMIPYVRDEGKIVFQKEVEGKDTDVLDALFSPLTHMKGALDEYIREKKLEELEKVNKGENIEMPKSAFDVSLAPRPRIIN